MEKPARYNQKAAQSSRAARLKETGLDGRHRDFSGRIDRKRNSTGEVSARKHETRSGVARSPFHIEIDREEDGRFIAEIPAIPGVMVYDATRGEAIEKVRVLALEVLTA